MELKQIMHVKTQITGLACDPIIYSSCIVGIDLFAFQLHDFINWILPFQFSLGFCHDVLIINVLYFFFYFFFFFSIWDNFH